MDVTARHSRDTASHELKGLVAACITMMILTTLFAALRWISRLSIKADFRRLGCDDYLLVPAYMFTIGTAANGLVIAHLERGPLPKDAPIVDDRLTPVLKSIYSISQLLYVATALPRLSLLFLYNRIFVSRPSKIASYLVMGLVGASWLSYACGSFFACDPAYSFWQPHSAVSCIDLDLFYRSFSVVNAVEDIAIVSLPIKPLLALETTSIRKAGIFLIFLTGSVGVIASCIRLSVFVKQHAFPPKPTVSGPFITWVVVESSMYFIAACLPSLGPLIRVLAQRAGLKQGSSSYHSYHSSSTTPQPVPLKDGVPRDGAEGLNSSYLRLVEPGSDQDERHIGDSEALR